MAGLPRMSLRRATGIAVAVLIANALIAGVVWNRSAAGEAAVIRMTVKRFEYAPHELRLKRGVPVLIEITSLDVVHGFTLPDFGVRADVVPGIPTRIAFTPDRAGTFTFRCDVFCGSGHEELDGTIVVTQ